VAGRLRLLWEGILGRGDFGDDDLFFDIGGTSLKAVRLLSLVKREFGVDLPVSVLAEAGTIDRLAGVIAGGERAKGMLLPLRQGGALPPLFILPGGGTEPFRYRELAALIEPDRPVIGVRYPGWDGVTRPPRTMDGLARAIVDELLPLVGAGPLLIVGASFGGLVAFEVARRLQACGIPVGLLAILDTQAPGNPVPLPGLSPGRAVRRLLLRLQPIGARARPSRELIREGLAHRWARLVALPSITWRRLRGIPLQHEYRYLSVLDAAFRITYRCRLPRSPLRILLFRASVGPSADLFTVDPLLGWGEMAQGGVEVHEVPGTHGDVGVGATAPLVAGIINRGIAGGERG
jgi:thioesterase domain-containing protein/acyl carrier protein